LAFLTFLGALIVVIMVGVLTIADNDRRAEASPQATAGPNVEREEVSYGVLRLIDHDFGMVCYVVTSGAPTGGRGIACLDRLGVLEP
jgi:hypothetical protein